MSAQGVPKSGYTLAANSEDLANIMILESSLGSLPIKQFPIRLNNVAFAIVLPPNS